MVLNRRSGAASSPRDRSKIDYSKYKTKICRHYQLGSCPFEDRCAFSHIGDVNSTISLESPSRLKTVKSENTLSEDRDPQSDSASNSDMFVLPPSYDIAIKDYESGTPTLCSPSYRYDPYSYDGVRFESDYNADLTETVTV